MSREPNFTAGASEKTLTIAASPRPEPPSKEAYATLAYLTAEVAYLAQRGQLSRIDDATEVRAAGGKLKPGSTVATIRRKAAAMLRHCPASPLPRHART